MSGEKTLLFSTFARLTVGAVFVYASFDKIIHPDQFVQNIIDYQLVPIPVAKILAYWLPWMELSTGALLIGGIWVRTSATLVSGMLVAFIVAIASAMMRGLVIQCGCFETGDGGDTIGWSRLIADFFLLGLSVWLVIKPSSKYAIVEE